VKPRIPAAILEDEALARRRLERLVAAHADLQLVGSYDNPLHARAVLEGVRLLFLDVEMPFEDGFTFLESLPAESKPYVIFTTAHGRHAVEAFRHDAVDFLLKPFDEASFGEAVERARGRIRAQALAESAARLAQALESDTRAAAPAAEAAPAFVGVRARDGEAELVIAPERIDWIRVEGRHLRLSSGGRVLVAAGTLAQYEQRLAAHRFLRIHRACLVNLSRVKSVRPRSHGDRILVLEDGQRLEMSRHYAARFDALVI
jgi:two-component system LytT family response regulator